jgi:hypothetical protein
MSEPHLTMHVTSAMVGEVEGQPGVHQITVVCDNEHVKGFTETLADGTEVERDDGYVEKGHHVHIPISAIGDRMSLYGLDTPQEAYEAILRETGARVSPAIDLDHPSVSVVGACGGMKSGISIRHGRGVAARVKEALAAYDEAITEVAESTREHPFYVAARKSIK